MKFEIQILQPHSSLMNIETTVESEDVEDAISTLYGYAVEADNNERHFFGQVWGVEDKLLHYEIKF